MNRTKKNDLGRKYAESEKKKKDFHLDIGRLLHFIWYYMIL